MKLCIVGNSHIGALKRGWDVARVPGVEATFFGAGGRNLRHVTLGEGKLIPSDQTTLLTFKHTSGGLECIDIPNYDAFWVVGCALGMASASQVLAGFRLHEWANYGDTRLVSEGMLRDMILSRVMKSLAVRTAGLIRSVTAAPIALIPEPLPTAQIMGVDGMWWWSDPVVRRAIRDLYLQALEELRADYPVADQPADTTIDREFTRQEFALKPGTGARILMPGFKTAKDDDLYHMNGDFGAAVIPIALKALSG